MNPDCIRCNFVFATTKCGTSKQELTPNACLCFLQGLAFRRWSWAPLLQICARASSEVANLGDKWNLSCKTSLSFESKTHFVESMACLSSANGVSLTHGDNSLVCLWTVTIFSSQMRQSSASACTFRGPLASMTIGWPSNWSILQLEAKWLQRPSEGWSSSRLGSRITQGLFQMVWCFCDC